MLEKEVTANKYFYKKSVNHLDICPIILTHTHILFTRILQNIF